MAAVSRIGDVLLRAKVVDELQLRSALAQQQRWGGRLGKVLVEMRLAKESAIVEALSKALSLPRVALDKVDRDPLALGKLEEPFAREKGLFPCALKDGGRTLWVAMADPSDLLAVDELSMRTRCRIRPVVAGEFEILAALDRHYLNKEPSPRNAFGGFLPLDGAGDPADATDDEFVITDVRVTSHSTDDSRTESAAPRGRAVAAMDPESRTAIDDLFEPVGEAPDDLTEEELARLSAVREVQDKATVVLRALVELSVEKGVFSIDEVRAKLK